MAGTNRACLDRIFDRRAICPSESYRSTRNARGEMGCASYTRALAERACFDCHSNETTWRWFDDIAPVSWYVANHINDGRRALNFSLWDQPNASFEEVGRTIKNDKMPLWDYLLLHPNAKLTADEKSALLSGLQATFQQDAPIPRPQRTGE